MKYQELGLEVIAKWVGLWNISHKLRDGSLSRAELNNLNALMDEGEEQILDIYLRGASPPASLYFRLGNNGGTPGVPAETVTLATITEVSGTGYGGIAVARDSTDWPTLALDGGDFQASSVTKTFTGGAGGWTAADYLILATVATGTSGKIIATVALSASRLLLQNDTLDVSMKVKLQ
jgi:hypothetical protein